MARLEVLRAGKAKKVSREERETVEREWRDMRGVAGRREAIVKEMWGMIEEVVENGVREELKERFEMDG